MRNEELVKGMSNCVNHCNWCADACLNEENLKDMVECIRLDRACAAVCRALNDILVTEYNDIQKLVLKCVKNVRKSVRNLIPSTVKTVHRLVGNVLKISGISQLNICKIRQLKGC
jgi:hypothetical protein